MINRHLALLTGLMVSSISFADHHKEPQTPSPVASEGQVIVMYEVPCSNMDAGLATLKTLIAYEAEASPIAYSSSPVMIREGVMGAVDLHLSVSSMEKAIAWQASDEKWKALQATSLEACNINIDDITATTMVAQ
jgi:hypothetical protein